VSAEVGRCVSEAVDVRCSSFQLHLEHIRFTVVDLVLRAKLLTVDQVTLEALTVVESCFVLRCLELDTVDVRLVKQLRAVVSRVEPSCVHHT
jgi:hypothetical protein